MEDKTYQYYTNSCKSYLAIKKQQKKVERNVWKSIGQRIHRVMGSIAIELLAKIEVMESMEKSMESITSENSVRENLITIMRTVSVKMHHISFKHFPHEFMITLFLSWINTCLQFLVNIILYQISILVQIFNDIYLNCVYFYYYYKFIFYFTINWLSFIFFSQPPCL